MIRFMTPDVPPHSKLEVVNARLPEGTSERIDRVLNGGELRSAFIRHAVEKELQYREADLPKTASRRRAL